MFPPDQVLAVTSDDGVDFTPQDFEVPLTQAQQAYLQTKTGRDIPQVFWRAQVHGDTVVSAQGAPSDCSTAPEADAFITNQPNLPIAIRTADCLPVFIFDPLKKAIGLVHAGWKGTQRQITAKTLKTMHDKFGSQCYNLHIFLGPAIGACCYEVGPEFRAYFSEDVSERDGHLFFDVTSANRRQLIAAGVLPENIGTSGQCTSCGKGYFSYRRDGPKAGRMISVMMLL